MYVLWNTCRNEIQVLIVQSRADSVRLHVHQALQRRGVRARQAIQDLRLFYRLVLQPDPFGLPSQCTSVREYFTIGKHYTSTENLFMQQTYFVWAQTR